MSDALGTSDSDKGKKNDKSEKPDSTTIQHNYDLIAGAVIVVFIGIGLLFYFKDKIFKKKTELQKK